MRNKDKVILYPAYFDSNKTKSGGRKLQKKLCIQSPKLQELENAARALGFEPTPEAKSYPKSWWERSGRVIVNKKHRKSEVIKEVARKMRESR
jgi:signal recognition particle subunit SRP19